MSDSIYFYSIARPEEGVLGTLTIDAGVFTTANGLSQVFIDSERKRWVLKNEAEEKPTDQDIFNVLADNWTNGLIFTLSKVVSTTDLKEYIG
jgi:hypothetical protein